MYTNVKSCVKHNGEISLYFNSYPGLMQGEVLSPVLFSLYVNDFEMNFIEENCPSCELQMLNIFLLMYADDTVIFAESKTELEKLLSSLKVYTDKWQLEVNVEKTKIVVFRNGGTVNDTWLYDGKPIKVVDYFNYLNIQVSSSLRNR